MYACRHPNGSSQQGAAAASFLSNKWKDFQPILICMATFYPQQCLTVYGSRSEPQRQRIFCQSCCSFNPTLSWWLSAVHSLSPYSGQVTAAGAWGNTGGKRASDSHDLQEPGGDACHRGKEEEKLVGAQRRGLCAYRHQKTEQCTRLAFQRGSI